MTPDPDLAKIAYDAYGEAVGGLNYMGLPMPPWDELPTKIHDGWVAATDAVVQAVAAAGEPAAKPEPKSGRR